jgi:rhamnose utilization protein RhaD (predicted bifunctional aldolase and dehydrogenase)
MSDPADPRQALITLSHDLGSEERGLAILGEGNVSAKLSETTFVVKASGATLATLTETNVTECRFAPLLAMLDQEDLSDKEVDDELFACRVDSSARKPSVEALFHAYLLSLPDVRFVGHTHPLHINQILCSPRAREFAARKLFPDDIVCCGPASVFVPYSDPGLSLSRIIRRETTQFVQDLGVQPRVILLENHGIITLGRSPDAVRASMFMAEKAAKIFFGAAALGGPHFLSQENVSRIGGRPDEHYRQSVLKL